MGASFSFLAVGALLVAFVYKVKINITTYNGAARFIVRIRRVVLLQIFHDYQNLHFFSHTFFVITSKFALNSVCCNSVMDGTAEDQETTHTHTHTSCPSAKLFAWLTERKRWS